MQLVDSDFKAIFASKNMQVMAAKSHKCHSTFPCEKEDDKMKV